MDLNVLRDHLTKLHEDLSATPREDAESNRMLGELKGDIDRMHQQPLDPGSLPDRLEQIALLFEVDHPTLAASSRRLVDLLGKVGL